MKGPSPFSLSESRPDETGTVPHPVRSQRSQFSSLLRLCRPEQWLKNLLVFAALIFSKHLFDIHSVGLATGAFACFCLLASTAYVVNDLRDAENDRRHPLKSRRPLASGEVAPGTAIVLACALGAAGLVLAAALGRGFFEIAVAYAALQAAYSFALKNVVIVDAMTIATGFVLRAVGGGVVLAVEVSPWLVICTFLLALFLAFSKRRHEVVLLGDGDAGAHRASLREYSPYFLDQMISVVTASTVVAYAIYTASPEVREKLHTDKLYLTIPFVLYGIFRYLYLVHQREGGGNPTRELLADPPLWLNVLLWIGTAVCLLYAR